MPDDRNATLLLAGRDDPFGTLPADAGRTELHRKEVVDFISFDPRLLEHLQLFVRRFERKESLIEGLEREVVHFNPGIDELMTCLPGKPQGVVLSLDQLQNDEPEF